MGAVKQVIVIRKDLNMRRGKEIAQGAHASLAFLAEKIAASTTLDLSDDMRTWFREGTAKICVQVSSEAELVDIHEKARKAGLPSHLIRDAGRTEFRGEPTLTACAIGPAAADAVDAITGHLALY